MSATTPAELSCRLPGQASAVRPNLCNHTEEEFAAVEKPENAPRAYNAPPHSPDRFIQPIPAASCFQFPRRENIGYDL